MNASMLLMTAWIAGADVVPAGCSSCGATPAPTPVAAPADCGCDPCAAPAKSAKLGLLTRLNGLFASKGKHKKSGDCGCDPCAAPACDECGSATAAPIVVPAPTDAPPVAAPEAPKEMPQPTDEEKKDDGAAKPDGIVIPQVVSPVSAPQRVPSLGSPSNPY